MSSSLKQDMHQRRHLLGTFVKTPAPMLCEVLGATALDVVCLDAEHAPFDRLTLDQCLYALKSEGMPSLVRVPSGTAEHIGNALDCGATGVIVPHVCSAQQARALVKACHFGAGGRGYAGSTRAAGYGSKSVAEHRANSAVRTVLVAQIEDLEALAAIEDIAAVDGIDCLFIGMIDLTVALGEDRPSAPKVVEAARQICDAGRRHNKALGIFLADASQRSQWQAEGVSVFLLASDHSFLKHGASALVASAEP